MQLAGDQVVVDYDGFINQHMLDSTRKGDLSRSAIEKG